MGETQFYSLISDTTFKFLWRSEVGRKYYERIIQYYFNIDLSNYQMRENELPSGGILKDYRLDAVLVSSDGKHIINIEMNRQDNFTLNRNQIYLHRIFGNVGSKDSSYKDLSEYQVEQINFNNFYFQDKNVCCNMLMLMDEVNKIHIENFKIHNIYIPACQKMSYNKVSKEIQLLTAKSLKEMRKIAGEDKELKRLVDEVEKLNRDEYFGALYNIEEENERWKLTYEQIGYDKGVAAGLEEGKTLGIEEGKNLGIEEGKTLGIEEGKNLGIEEGKTLGMKEVAKNLYNQNIDISVIVQATGLTEEEIHKLGEE